VILIAWSAQVQGPCSMDQIREWQRAGLFTPDMLVRRGIRQADRMVVGGKDGIRPLWCGGRVISSLLSLAF
jgi:hypothetical protein